MAFSQACTRHESSTNSHDTDEARNGRSASTRTDVASNRHRRFTPRRAIVRSSRNLRQGKATLFNVLRNSSNATLSWRPNWSYTSKYNHTAANHELGQRNVTFQNSNTMQDWLLQQMLIPRLNKSGLQRRCSCCYCCWERTERSFLEDRNAVCT